MRQFLSTLSILFFISILFSQKVLSANDNQLITQMKVVDKDSTFRYLYVYDNGNKVVECKYFMQDSIWIRQSLNEWVYDGNNCILQREKIWKNNSWFISYTIDYKYDNVLLQSETHNSNSGTNAIPLKKIENQYNLNLLKVKKEYSWQSNVWHLSVETDFNYLPNSKTDSILIRAYQADTLNDQFLSTFHYDNSGLLVSQLQQEKKHSVWVKTDSINWFYYPNSSLIQTQKNKKWNSDFSAWENFQRIDYEYNINDQILSESYQHWKTMFWENNTRYDYHYDGNYNLLKKTLSMPVYKDWRALVSINYSDFTSNKANTIQSQFEFWGGKTGDLTNSCIPFVFNSEIAIKHARSIQLGYQQFKDTLLATTSLKYDYSLIRVYPNPSNGIYYMNSHQIGIKYWTITDLNGRILKKDEQTVQSGVIDITDLPKGIYILRVVTAENQSFQKLIKQ